MSLFQKVASVVGAAYVGVLLLWFALPLMFQIYQTVTGWSFIDQNDPVIQQMFAFGNTIFIVLGAVVFLVVLWTWIANATERDPRDII